MTPVYGFTEKQTRLLTKDHEAGTTQGRKAPCFAALSEWMEGPMVTLLRHGLWSLLSFVFAMMVTVGICLPLPAYAQTEVETQVDTPAMHFREYMLNSLDPLLTEGARREIASGRLRPSLSTFRRPARYGLIAAADTPNIITPEEILCLNRENHSLQLACRREDGSRQMIFLSAGACLRRVPLTALVPRGCRPYVSTIEGRPVTIRRAQRPQADVDLNLAAEGPEAVTMTPPGPTAPPSPTEPHTQRPIGTSGPSEAAHVASVHDPPATPSASVNRALVKENKRLRSLLAFTALLLALGVAYTLLQSWKQSRTNAKEEEREQEEPPPDVTIDAAEAEAARASLLRERDEARAQAATVLERKARVDEHLAQALTKASYAEQAGTRQQQEIARLENELLSIKSIDEMLRRQLTEAEAARKAAEDEAGTSERARYDQATAAAAVQERLLAEKAELVRENTLLKRQLTERDARDRATRDAAAAKENLAVNVHSDTITPFAPSPQANGTTSQGLHPLITAAEETPTQRLADADLLALNARTHAEADAAEEHRANNDGMLDFGDLHTDLPVVRASSHPTLTDPSEEKTNILHRDGPLSAFREPTKVQPACLDLRHHANPRSGKALTTKMERAERDPLIAMTRAPLDDDQATEAPPRDSLRELGELTRTSHSGTWSVNELKDEGEKTPPTPPRQAASGANENDNN